MYLCMYNSKFTLYHYYMTIMYDSGRTTTFCVCFFLSLFYFVFFFCFSFIIFILYYTIYARSCMHRNVRYAPFNNLMHSNAIHSYISHSVPWLMLFNFNSIYAITIFILILFRIWYEHWNIQHGPMGKVYILDIHFSLLFLLLLF